MTTKAKPKQDLRIAALIRFATAITILNIAGYSFLGFEHSWSHLIVAVLSAYVFEILMEWIYARTHGLKPRFVGCWKTFAKFLLPAHITSQAVSMLLFSNNRLMPVIFAVAIAIISKYIFRATIKGRSRHYFNPSNFGIAVVLILFPWVGIAPPYQFTENFSGAPDWVFPAVLICVGSFLNWRYTKKIPLIAAWLGVFFLQAIVRGLIFGTSITAGLIPMTGVAFLLFTFYMVSDPGTTPFARRGQIIFGASVGLAYAFLMMIHVVFGLFFALAIVCAVRGLVYNLDSILTRLGEMRKIEALKELQVVPQNGQVKRIPEEIVES